MEPKTYVCRCSDVTLEDVQTLIKMGYHTFDEVKRLLRTGMGPCQGKNCTPIILRELSLITGKPIEELMPGKYRPPVKAVSIGALTDQEGEECHG